jgi:hypothetical protein
MSRSTSERRAVAPNVPLAPVRTPSSLDASRAGGIATRDGFAARYEERTGESWYAHISPGGKPRPRHSIKEFAGRARGGRLPRPETKREAPITDVLIF